MELSETVVSMHITFLHIINKLDNWGKTTNQDCANKKFQLYVHKMITRSNNHKRVVGFEDFGYNNAIWKSHRARVWIKKINYKKSQCKEERQSKMRKQNHLLRSALPTPRYRKMMRVPMMTPLKNKKWIFLLNVIIST